MGIQREFQIFTGDLVDKFRPFLKEDHWKLTGNLMGIHGIFGNLLTSPFLVLSDDQKVFHPAHLRIETIMAPQQAAVTPDLFNGRLHL